MDRQQALDVALSQIERQFGKGSVMKMNDHAAVSVGAVSTGSLSLDLALGIGGLPRGRIVEIFGPESSGKTTLIYHVIAEAQKLGGVCAFIDAEHAMDPLYARNLGVDIIALLAMAVCDASIAVFDTKYDYDFWRPVTAIRAADCFLRRPPRQYVTPSRRTLVNAGLATKCSIAHFVERPDIVAANCGKPLSFPPHFGTISGFRIQGKPRAVLWSATVVAVAPIVRRACRRGASRRFVGSRVAMGAVVDGRPEILWRSAPRSRCAISARNYHTVHGRRTCRVDDRGARAAEVDTAFETVRSVRAEAVGAQTAFVPQPRRRLRRIARHPRRLAHLLHTRRLRQELRRRPGSSPRTGWPSRG